MIKIDMQMPDCCSECRFDTESGFCKAMPDNFCGYTIDYERPEWCPLKEQEAVEPKLVGVNTWTCGECGALLGWDEFSQSGLELVKYKYCPECGQAVKWE